MNKKQKKTIKNEDLTCEVYLWSKRVGVITQRQGKLHFTYDRVFLNSGLEISPLLLPLSRSEVIDFPSLRTDDYFQGLPGVFADSLPDKFGNKVLNNFIKDKYGSEQNELSQVQRLLYVGERAMGALEYRPAENNYNSLSKDALDVADLASQSRKIIRGDVVKDSNMIMKIGSSAGGARAKALIGWDRKNSKFIAGTHKLPNHFEYWMIKFDGTEDGNPLGYGRIEYAYSLMLKDCGINAPQTHLLEERDRAHFMVKRFDRDDRGDKIHMISLGGLIHSNYNEPHTSSYREFLSAIHSLTDDMNQVKEGFRRMVFNVIARNQDDHVKNFSFLMNREGKWTFSPSYDQTYAMGTGYTASHQMTLNGKSDDFTREDLMQLAESFDLDRSAGRIIDVVSSVVSNWDSYAKRAGVSNDHMNKLRGVHRCYLGNSSEQN